MYIYQAALLCDECGEAQRLALNMEDGAPEDPSDETTYDSDVYPKGPYDDTEEADSPQHCDECAVFLLNDLTEEGKVYAGEAIVSQEGDTEVLDAWAEHYADLYSWVNVADLDDDDKEALSEHCDNVGTVYGLEQFEDAYLGTWDSEQVYAENLVDDLGMLLEMPDNLRLYFDYAAFARDLFMTDCTGYDVSGGVAVFLNY